LPSFGNRKVPLVYLVEAERRVPSGTGRVPFFGHPPADKGRGVISPGTVEGKSFYNWCYYSVSRVGKSGEMEAESDKEKQRGERRDSA
jgi:hypothetical protein